MTTKEKKKKEFEINTWTFKDRKHPINIHISNPTVILFEMGYHQPIDPNSWDRNILSRVQKQLKQFLYNYLSANKLVTDSYVLVLDGSKLAKGSSTFIDMKVAFPTLGDLEANKAFCYTLTEKMSELMNVMTLLN